MTYLIVYLAIGIAVLLFSLTQQHMQKGFASDLAKIVAGELHPERRLWRYRLMHGMIVPTLAGLLMIVIWPFAIYLFINTQRNRAKDMEEEIPIEPQFAVDKTHLVEQISLQEIETNELVFDPMDAVPNIPFGHLNASWQAFITDMEPNDSLWTFSAPWKSDWGQPEDRKGYAIVRNNAIAKHYVTICRGKEFGL